MIWIKAYAGALTAFLIIDLIWLGVVAKDFYRGQLGHLMLDKPNVLAAALFYLAYVAIVVFLAVQPAIAKGSWTTAALYGAILGLFAYGTYDMTNLATLKDWPVPVVIVDMIWGICLTGASATAGYLATRIGA